MKNLKTIMLTFAIVMLSVGMGFSQKGMNGQMNPNNPKIFKVIPDLTQDQKDKILNDKTEMMKKVTPLNAEMKVKKAEMDVLMTKNSTLKEKEALAKEMNDLKFQIQMARIEHHDNVRALLNDNQKVAFDNWTINHHNGMKKGNHGQRKMNGQGYGPRNGNGYGNGPRQGMK